MYITDGVRINADAVGAFNILRKYLSVSGKQRIVRNRTKKIQNNKSSCIAERQNSIGVMDAPEKGGIARFQMLW